MEVDNALHSIFTGIRTFLPCWLRMGNLPSLDMYKIRVCLRHLLFPASSLGFHDVRNTYWKNILFWQPVSRRLLWASLLCYFNFTITSYRSKILLFEQTIRHYRLHVSNLPRDDFGFGWVYQQNHPTYTHYLTLTYAVTFGSFFCLIVYLGPQILNRSLRILSVQNRP